MSDLEREFLKLLGRVSELERRIRSQSRTGVISEVDAGKGLARVRLLEGDRPFISGWLPWEEASAGANKTHVPPSVGQQVRIYSESGDLHDATIQNSINSDANGRPSGNGDEFILLNVGLAKISVIGGGAEIRLQVGASYVAVTAAGVTVDGARVDVGL